MASGELIWERGTQGLSGWNCRGVATDGLRMHGSKVKAENAAISSGCHRGEGDRERLRLQIWSNKDKYYSIRHYVQVYLSEVLRTLIRSCAMPWVSRRDINSPSIVQSSMDAREQSCTAGRPCTSARLPETRHLQDDGILFRNIS